MEKFAALKGVERDTQVRRPRIFSTAERAWTYLLAAMQPMH